MTLVLRAALLTTSALCTLASSQNLVWRAYGQAPAELLGSALGTISDLDADAVPELLASGAGMVRVLSGRTGAVLRTLRSVTPQDAFGQAVAGMPDVTESGMPARALNFNGSCFLHLDVPTLLPLLAVPNSGTWFAPLPLPADVTFAGLPLRLQALFVPTAGFLGLDLTNGVEWRLGY
jgi:hypothetical protein